MPVSTQWQLGGFFDVATAGSWMFASALFVALPAVAAILVVNFAFGVMTRAAPQMNIISIGFPFTMMIGLFVMWVSLSGFLPQYERLVSESLMLIKNMYAIGSLVAEENDSIRKNRRTDRKRDKAKGRSGSSSKCEYFVGDRCRCNGFICIWSALLPVE